MDDIEINLMENTIYEVIITSFNKQVNFKPFGIKFNNKYQNPCFKIEEPQEYNTKDILEKLYISCFGISDCASSVCTYWHFSVKWM